MEKRIGTITVLVTDRSVTPQINEIISSYAEVVAARQGLPFRDRPVAVISLIAIGIIRPLGGYLLTYTAGLGLYGAWLGILIDQSMRLILSSARVRKGKWLEIQL